MQRIRSTVDEKEQKQLLMDLDVVMRSSDCDYIVKFYGALFTEVITFSPFQMTLKGYDNDYKYLPNQWIAVFTRFDWLP